MLEENVRSETACISLDKEWVSTIGGEYQAFANAEPGPLFNGQPRLDQAENK